MAQQKSKILTLYGKHDANYSETCEKAIQPGMGGLVASVHIQKKGRAVQELTQPSMKEGDKNKKEKKK